MTRTTSIDAYNSIVAQGILGKIQLRIYDHFYNHGPLTAKQVAVALRVGAQHWGTYTTRLSELRRMDALREVGTTIDPDTKREVILWDVTDRVPVKLSKKLSYKAKLKLAEEFIKEIQLSDKYEEYVDLRGVV